MKKSFSLLIAFLLICSMLLAIPVFASSTSTVTQDGLEVAIRTDNDEYAADEDIQVSLIILNTNDYRLDGVSIDAQLPDGLVLKNGNLSTPGVCIEVGASYSTELVAQLSDALKENEETQPEEPTEPEVTEPETTVQEAGSPSTGDDTSILLLCVLLVVSGVGFVLIIKYCKSSQIVCLILCFALILSMLPVQAVAVQGTTGTITVEKTILVDSKPYTISFILTYPIEEATKNLTVNMENLYYDEASGQYLLFDAKSSFTGTLAQLEGITEASYQITDRNGTQLLSGTFVPDSQWEICNLGFVVGENNVTISVKYENGHIDQARMCINNLCPENMDVLDMDKGDDDDDGVLNYIEILYLTDPQKSDTDGDGLPDYEEMAILNTSPLQTDSDADGITDNLEDADQDGLSNGDEILPYGTNPLSVDSDGDGLTDYDEVNVHKTSPVNADTDEDGISDYWEIRGGFDPLTYTADFGDYMSEVTVNCSDERVSVTVVFSDAYLNSSLPGYMGINPCEVALNEVESCEISIPFTTPITRSDVVPTIYYFNENTQRLEEMSTTITEDGRAATTVTQSGTYILLDRRLVTDVWENDFLPPALEGVNNGTIDVVFVIDRSASMNDNDPDAIRKEVVKQFIQKLRDQDRAAIVQFTSIAETIMPITGNKEALINAVDSIVNSDGGGCIGTDTTAGTNGAAGIRNALDELTGSTAAYKHVIFLTDGADTHTPEDYSYDDLIIEATNSDVVIHTIGLVGSGEVNATLLKQIAYDTGGSYYLATVGSSPEVVPEDVLILEDVGENLENITLDRVTDSNGDGISDYYTKLMCEGKMLTTKETLVFGGATYEEVQANADFDGDGLDNGEEIVFMECESGVYPKLFSYPYLPDSDFDGLSDFFEITLYNSNALRFNHSISMEDEMWLTEGENFVSNKFKSDMDRVVLGDLKRGSVFIGNAFFGSAESITLLYEHILLQYFKTINELTLEQKELAAYSELSYNLTAEALSQLILGLSTSDIPLNDEQIDTITTFVKTAVNDIPGVADAAAGILMELKGLSDSKEVANRLKTVESLTKSLDGSWEGLKVADYASPETYRQAAYNLMDKFKQTSAQIPGLQSDLKISKTFESIDNTVTYVGFFFSILDIAQTGIDTYIECQRFMNHIEVIGENIYILDQIIAYQNSDENRDIFNNCLVAAAQNIKEKLLRVYEEDMDSAMDLFLSWDSLIPVGSKLASEAVHFAIGKAGAPGAIIELVRAVGNLVLKLGDVSKECIYLYGITTTADIMSDRYEDYLYGGNGLYSPPYWFFYGDNGAEGIQRMKNLIVARIAAETQMIASDQAKSFLVEWMYTLFIYNLKDCEANITTAKNILTKY